MDHITNEIQVPMSRIEEALRQAAVAGWWGSVSISLQLCELQPGLYELQYHVTRTTTTQTDVVREAGSMPLSDRVHEAMQRLGDCRQRLKIIIPVPELKCSFKDGRITGPIQIVERFWVPAKL